MTEYNWPLITCTIAVINWCPWENDATSYTIELCKPNLEITLLGMMVSDGRTGSFQWTCSLGLDLSSELDQVTGQLNWTDCIITLCHDTRVVTDHINYSFSGSVACRRTGIHYTFVTLTFNVSISHQTISY